MQTSTRRVLADGLLAGGIGFFSSALLFSIINLLQGENLLHTPAVIGSVLFYGFHDTTQLAVTAGPVIACNGLYLALYILLGCILSAFAEAADKAAHILYLLALVMILATLHLVGAAVVLNAVVFTELPWWSIALAGIAGSGTMVFYLYRRHPLLRAELLSAI